MSFFCYNVDEKKQNLFLAAGATVCMNFAYSPHVYVGFL